MNMTTEAPDLKPGYPSRGSKLGPAWNALWAELQAASQKPDPFMDGIELAGRVAPDYGLAPSTLIALLTRMATGGILARDSRPVMSGRGARQRTFYGAPRA